MKKPNLSKEFDLENEIEEILSGHTVIDNPCLSYTIYKFLEEFDLRFMSKTRFYKFLFLIYKRLEKRGIDIQLPYFWYYHGNVVSESTLPVAIEYTSDVSRQIPNRIPKPEVDIEEEKKKMIDETIGIMKEREERINTEQLIDRVYEHAPLKFQTLFRDFKKNLDNYDANLAYNNLSDLFNEFPKSEFPELHPLFLRTTSLLRNGLRRKVFFDELVLLTGEFWEVFCKKLAILHNNNIPRDLSGVFLPKYQEGITELRGKIREVEKLFVTSETKEPILSSDVQASYEECLEEFLKSKYYL